jgi:hypothetical protein
MASGRQRIMERRWFRVELRGADGPRLLGYVPDVRPHPASLTPFVSRLLLEGIAVGEVVLIDEATGQDVARRHVRRWRAGSGQAGGMPAEREPPRRDSVR